MPIPAPSASAEDRRTTGRPDFDPPESGTDHAEQDFHQGRLAGAVLAEQAVDRAGRDAEVDAVFAQTGPKCLETPRSRIAGGAVSGRKVPTPEVVGPRAASVILPSAGTT